MRHQHPAAASLLDGMELLARGGLRDLVEEGVGIVKHHCSHRSASRQFLVADRSDLGRLAVRHGVHQRADAGLDEIDPFKGL
jgi:hypothetical protein